MTILENEIWKQAEREKANYQYIPGNIPYNISIYTGKYTGSPPLCDDGEKWVDLKKCLARKVNVI